MQVIPAARLADSFLVTAIWPAGPPKESAATLSQVQKASRSETAWLGTGWPPRERISGQRRTFQAPFLTGQLCVSSVASRHHR